MKVHVYKCIQHIHLHYYLAACIHTHYKDACLQMHTTHAFALAHKEGKVHEEEGNWSVWGNWMHVRQEQHLWSSKHAYRGIHVYCSHIYFNFLGPAICERAESEAQLHSWSSASVSPSPELSRKSYTPGGEQSFRYLWTFDFGEFQIFQHL